MTKSTIKNYLSILNINSIKQLDENDLDFWHQKRFIEIEKSGQDKNTISKQLIDLNNAKDYLDSIELNEIKQILGNKFQVEKNIDQKYFLSRDQIYKENLNNQEEFDEDFVEDFDEDYENKLINQGVKNIELENYSEAIFYFSLVIDMNPESEYAFYNRGICRYENKNYTAVIEDLSKAINLKGELSQDHFIYYLRGLAKEKINQFKSASDDLNQALNLLRKKSYLDDEIQEISTAILRVNASYNTRYAWGCLGFILLICLIGFLLTLTS